MFRKVLQHRTLKKWLIFLTNVLLEHPLFILQKTLLQETKMILEQHIHQAGELYSVFSTSNFNYTRRTFVFRWENEYDESARIQ